MKLRLRVKSGRLGSSQLDSVPSYLSASDLCQDTAWTWLWASVWAYHFPPTLFSLVPNTATCFALLPFLTLTFLVCYRALSCKASTQFTCLFLSLHPSRMGQMHPKHSARRTFSITKFGTPFLLSLTFSSNLFETCTSKLVPACPGAAQGPQQLSPALPPSCKLACTALRIWEPSSWPFRDLVAIRNQSRAMLILNKSSRSSLAARLKFPFSQNKD